MAAWCKWCLMSITLEQAEKGYYGYSGFGFCSKECKEEYAKQQREKMLAVAEMASPK